MGTLALTAALLAMKERKFGGLLPENQRIRFITFTTRSGADASAGSSRADRHELDSQAQDVSLHVGYGNVLKALGYWSRLRLNTATRPKSRRTTWKSGSAWPR